MLYVHRSNRVERLVETLAEHLGVPLADPMATEVVVVHSQGMQRWLSQRLSQRLGAPAGTNAGICANVEYPFPATVVRRVLAGCLGEDPDAPDPWEPDRLVWTLLSSLPALLEREEFAQLSRYLDHDNHSFGVASVGRRRFALARHIADLFDRYAVYRPWMARGWSAGEVVGPDPGTRLPDGYAWQPLLWKALQDQVERDSQADRFARAIQVLGDRTGPLAELPARINFFGLSTLPPSYLELLQALARVQDVHLFLLCPSREYWAEIRDRREILARTRDPHEVDAELALEVNPILASFGRLARDFQLHLESDQAPHYHELGDQPFEDPTAASVEGTPEGATMLEVVQSDVLHLRTRGARPDADDRLPARVEDRSIRVHSCHGMTRQVEVLREAILRAMEAPGSDLEPRDVVVMTPDIEAYAPIVAAVFSEGQANAREGADAGERWGDVGAPGLPFSIADRSLRDVNPVASALMHVLEMVHGRVEASTVLDLLRMDVVRQRFDVGAEDMAQIEVWVRDSGIRWGIDADHREKHDQPADYENTWRFGLDRLLLGVAMADEQERSFAGAVPFDDIEGGAVDLLGRFAEFCELLFSQLRALDHPRPLEDWRIGLEWVLDRLVRTEESHAWQVQQVRDVLAGLVDRSCGPEGDPFAAPLELDAMRSLLSGGFEVGPGSIGHQTGAITFCAMVPMRSIPHRVVCLLGMDDAAFPRGDHAQALDLIAVRRQVGDRSPREEDRFLFLEAILAAREQLIVTYTGHDIRTNEALPPAVPVGQLLDVLDGSFVPAPGHARVREQVTVQHPLQAFSPRNFDAAAPLAYDRRMLAGARCLSAERPPAPAFLSGPLARTEDTEEDGTLIELSELVRFWDAPVKWLVTRRLGLSLRRDDQLVEDREAIELDHLARWQVGAQLLDHELRGSEGDWVAAMMGRGGLPPGAPGQCTVEDASVQVARILEASALVRATPPHALTIDVDLPEQRLVGTVGSLHGSHLTRLQFGTIRPKHRLAQWIHYLALYAQQPETDWDAAIYGKDNKPRALPVLSGEARGEQARLQLQALVEGYLRGRDELLPFFNKTSYAYASTVRRRGESAAFGAAAREWEGDFGPIPGERDDAYVAQVFGHECPFRELLGLGFRELASDIWNPILNVAEGK